MVHLLQQFQQRISLPEKWRGFFYLFIFCLFGGSGSRFSVTGCQDSVPKSQDRAGFSVLFAFPEAEEQAGVPGDRAVYPVGQKNPDGLGRWRTGSRLHLPESI